MEKRLEKAFKDGAIFITLTYTGEPPSEKVAKKELHKFLLRVTHWRRKNGLPALKYVAVTESKKTKVHHHLLMNPMDISQAKMTALWGLGRAKVDKRIQNGEYPDILKYLNKENGEEQRSRWLISKNIKDYILSFEVQGVHSHESSKVGSGYSSEAFSL